MATFALSIAGNALAGPIGGFAGGILGSYLDNAFGLTGLLGGDDNTIEPKPPELSIQGSEEGHPENFLIGPNVPAVGSVIWLGPLKSEKIKQRTGGKGGGDEKVVGYRKYISLAIAISRGRETQKTLKVFANGRKFYDDDPTQTITGKTLDLHVDSATQMDLVSPSDGPDLSVFRDGLDITFTGFANSSNNGTFRVISVVKANTGVTRLRFRNPFGITENPSPQIIATQVQPKFLPEHVRAISFYQGTHLQDADPHLESFEGVGEVPAWRGRSYMVLEDFELGPFGNQIPQFRIIQQADTSDSVANAISAIMNRSGYQNSQFDVTEVSSDLQGMALRGLVAGAKSLQPLMAAYDIIEQETEDGTIRFFDRTKAKIVDIDPGDLRAHEDGADTKGLVEVIPGKEIDIPSEVVVSYIDLDAENQRGSQSHVNRSVSHTNVMKVNLPIVLSGGGGEAKKIAKIFLWIRKIENTKYRLSLPPKYMHTLENDVLRLPVHGIPMTLLVRRLEQGANQRIECDCVQDVREIFTQLGIADPPATQTSEPEIPPQVQLEIIDVPFGGGNTPTPGGGPAPTAPPPGLPGHGIGGSNVNPQRRFRGSRVFISDDDDEFLPLLDVVEDATQGRANTVLGTATGGSWDRENKVTVELYSGELESLEEDDVLNGFNIAVLGDEIIGFKNATLVDDYTYELSHLLRGLRDTKDEMPNHAQYERFVLLDSAIVWNPISLAQVGRERHYKMVAIGGDVSDVDSQAVTVQGKNLRPFSPVDVSAVRNGTDIDLSWNRRTRAVVRLFQPKPIYEAFERYEVDVLYPAGSSTVVRTIVVNDATQVTYTGAQKDMDGVGTTAPVDFRVYQISDVIGRGKSSDLIELGGS